jgi:ABC-type transport system involved in multi-copper enzyme maturation permease subunit
MDVQTPEKVPLHARVAGWLEFAFNPIMVKELRGSMRASRFFATHLTLLSLFACGLLLAFSSQIAGRSGNYPSGEGVLDDPSQVGRAVFLITQSLHLAIVFLIVPGLAAASITSERESLTHELLLSTTLTAQEIVWGKFTAAMVQTFMIFISFLPLVSLCFLFGGVTVYQILANYAFLIGLSALMIAFALSISANARTTARATVTAYALALLAGGIVLALLTAGGRGVALIELGLAYGFVSPGLDVGTPTGRHSFERILYVYLLPAGVWTALFSLYFITATNRLKPIFANRTTNLRIFYVAALFGLGSLVLLALRHELDATGTTSDRATALTVFVLGMLTVTLISSLFACEDPIPPAALEAQAASMVGWRRIYRLLWPGSARGALFCTVSNGGFVILACAALLPLSKGFDRGPWTGMPEPVPLAFALVSAVVWAYFCAMFARYLAAALPGRPVLLRSVLVVGCLFLALFPLIHWAILSSIDPDPLDTRHEDGPLTLGVSPVAAVLASLELSSSRREFPFFVGRIPIPAIYLFVGLSAGTVLSYLAGRSETRHLERMRTESGPGPEPRREVQKPVGVD